MSTATLQFNDAGLGVWSEETHFEVTRERLAEYAAAVNDPIPAHRAGDVANPVFAIVPVFHSLLEPAIEIVPLSVLGKSLHGEQDFRFHRPIVPGDKLTARAKMTGFEGLANGTRACVYLETRDHAGQLVNEQYVTFFVRGFTDDRRIGELSPGHKFDEAVRATDPAAGFIQHIDEDQTYRYAPASGDPMPIHIDEQAAVDSGLPGIIAHGFCTLAFTAWGLLHDLGGDDAARMKRLAVRFAKPVLPGQDIATTAWRSGGDGSRARYVYETKVGDAAVIRDGLAELEA